MNPENSPPKKTRRGKRSRSESPQESSSSSTFSTGLDGPSQASNSTTNNDFQHSDPQYSSILPEMSHSKKYVPLQLQQPFEDFDETSKELALFNNPQVLAHSTSSPRIVPLRNVSLSISPDLTRLKRMLHKFVPDPKKGETSYIKGLESIKRKDFLSAWYQFRTAFDHGFTMARFHCISLFREGYNYKNMPTSYEWRNDILSGLQNNEPAVILYYKFLQKRSVSTIYYDVKMDLKDCLRKIKDEFKYFNLDPILQTHVGWCFTYALGCEKSYSIALKHFQFAIGISNYPGAIYSTGAAYQYSRGVDQDFVTAAKYYKTAADMGQADAQNDLGFLYDRGKGFDINIEKALEWYRKGAERWNPHSLHNIAASHMSARGVPKDREKAVHFFTLAAKVGHFGAERQLFSLYNQHDTHS